jgi:ethanolamine utilization protein EutN
MYLGRIVGCVWATVKNPAMMGLRMVVVQPVTPELRDTGKRLICTDSTGAGSGELIYWVRGKEASFPFGLAEPPVDTTIVGIVDSVHLASQAAPLPVEVVTTSAAPIHIKDEMRPVKSAAARRGRAKTC